MQLQALLYLIKMSPLYVSCLLAILLSSICGVKQFKKLDIAAKIFCTLICLSCLCEYLAYFSSKKWHNNSPIYSIYSLVEFVAISLYFNYSIDTFRSKNIGYYIGAVGFIIGVLNIIYLQPLNTFNSYYLFFEGIAIITMSLFSFFRMLMREDSLVLYTYPNFWFTAILSFLWSSSFLNWGFSDYVYNNHREKMWLLGNTLYIINIVTYVTIAAVFLLFPKMKTKYV